MTKLICETCKFHSVSVLDEPCYSCIPHWARDKDADSPRPGWQPKEQVAEKTSAREERLQAQVDTYRQALRGLMGSCEEVYLYSASKTKKIDPVLFSWQVWQKCNVVLDNPEPMPARSDAQADAYQHALGDLMMQCEKLRLENKALLAERDEARKVAKHIYENKQLIFKYAWLEP